MLDDAESRYELRLLHMLLDSKVMSTTQTSRRAASMRRPIRSACSALSDTYAANWLGLRSSVQRSQEARDLIIVRKIRRYPSVLSSRPFAPNNAAEQRQTSNAKSSDRGSDGCLTVQKGMFAICTVQRNNIDSGVSDDTVSNTATSAFPRPPFRRIVTSQASQQHRTMSRQAEGGGWSKQESLHAFTMRAQGSDARARFVEQSDRNPEHVDGADDWIRGSMEQLRYPEDGIKRHRHLDSGADSPNRRQTQQQRPLISSGLPTSYNDFRNRSRSVSCSALLPHTFSLESSLAPKTKPDDGVASSRLSSPQIPSPSPALHFTKQDRSWSDLLSGKLGDTCSLAHLHSRTHSLGTSSSLYDRSSRLSSAVSFQTRPTSSASSEDPYRLSCRASEQVSSGRSPRSLCTTTAPARELRSPGKPLSDHGLRQSSMHYLQTTSPAATALNDQRGSRQQVSIVEGLRPSRPLMRRAATSSVTTEQVIGPQYLEPVNSCEGYFFPRPRLRTHSLNTVPSEAVDQLHAVPERFWQRDLAIDGADNIHAARASVVKTSNADPITLLRASRQFGSTSSQVAFAYAAGPERDPRLTLHENMPPPPLPKVSQEVPCGLVPSKPPPPTPWPSTSPEHSESQDSACSLDVLKASELLERNEALELERQAWREEHRTSLGVGSNSFLGRLSPCLREPPPVPDRTRGGALSSGMNDADEIPIQVHRVRNEDGTEHTLLLVRAQRSHPRFGLNRPSTPEMRDRLIATVRPSSLVKHISQRLGSLSSTRRSLATSSAQGNSMPRDGTLTRTQMQAYTVRPLKEGRRLVTNETVVIGRQQEHPEGFREQDSWNPIESHLQPEVQMGNAISDMRKSIAGRTLPARSGYQAAGTRDEIRAFMNEGKTSTWVQKICCNGVVEAEKLTPDYVLDIDPGTSVITCGDLSVSESPADGHHLFNTEPSSSCGIPARLATPADSRDSGNSSGRHGDFAVWDASNVSLDNLFFRPPQHNLGPP
ncbi:hypothetical protein PHSY_003010 [Pseudozyma hubeiensis SY62]|uniref:Uncharacterized protein n=1 Tax=Pseudozyma hubeiensis (strain SY62) TaxID=1305764 RepID=R9P2F6_PSEHS|nr:hypothetical protein PHSY_003010 [Pseudozyma hubeiensis SY62]GAC95434.1 hypothetical protein PHSY_003010 [Pseudozyma hubeiensis SY62]